MCANPELILNCIIYDYSTYFETVHFNCSSFVVRHFSICSYMILSSINTLEVYKLRYWWVCNH